MQQSRYLCSYDRKPPLVYFFSIINLYSCFYRENKHLDILVNFLVYNRKVVSRI
nr:MAG TPA: hypothetical protein [Caudoviricetes sp.]